MGERWSTLRIRLLCDNQAVVHCIATGISRCPHLMSLLHNLFLLAARHNFNISARYIPEIHNNIVDSLSRFLMQDFRNQAPLGLPPPMPHPSLAAIRADMRHFLQHSLALSTRASYNSATRSFTHFALTYNRLHSDGSLLPASEETLMLFTTYLSYSLKPQSIKVYLAAVRNMHIEHGLPNPIAEATQLRRLLRGIKRLHCCTTDSRLPITPTLLRSFRLFLNFTYTDHLTLWAAMLVAFFSFLRSNELIALLHSDLQRIPEGYRVQIRCSKTDPFRAGATICLTSSGDGTLCAVTALNHLRATASSWNGPLFWLRSGAVLTRHRLNHLIQDLTARSGVPPGRYSSHSFKIGPPPPLRQPRVSQTGRSRPSADGPATATSATYGCQIRRQTPSQQLWHGRNCKQGIQ